jgi:hypothetical protein
MTSGPCSHSSTLLCSTANSEENDFTSFDHADIVPRRVERATHSGLLALQGVVNDRDRRRSQLDAQIREDGNERLAKRVEILLRLPHVEYLYRAV